MRTDITPQQRGLAPRHKAEWAKQQQGEGYDAACHKLCNTKPGKAIVVIFVRVLVSVDENERADPKELYGEADAHGHNAAADQDTVHSQAKFRRHVRLQIKKLALRNLRQ